jgi:glycosyltransferase involved in cell wall biosynthesis
MNQSETNFPFVLCQIEPPQAMNGGDYYYRTHSPGLCMAREKGVFVINLTSEHRKKWKIAAEANVLVLKNICDPDFLPLIKKRKEQGKVTVFEIADDLSAIEPWNPVHFFYKDRENQSLIWRLAGYCDALQVTCPTLRDLYGHLNPVCRVFPNQISHVPQERLHRRRSGSGLIVGWGGSHGHLQDLAEIAGPLSEWIMTVPEASLYLMGSDPIWRLFEGLPGEKKRRFQPGTILAYYDFLKQIDIGIGPLKDTAFNRSRSDVKFLEYAASGAVPVMKKLAPYTDTVRHGETGFLYDTVRDLIQTLTLLAGDPIFMEGVAASGREYVLHQRLEQDHARDRVAFYRELLLKTNGADDCHHLSEQVNGWAAMDGAVVTGRHIRLEPTKFEMLLQDGLVTMQVTKDREAAYRLLRRASALEPGNYLPYLYSAPISLSPSDTLAKAIELNPTSLKARIMLGDIKARHGYTLEALRCFSEAADIFPDYEIPFSRAASVLRQIGQGAQAEQLSEKAASLYLHGPCPPASPPEAAAPPF